MNNMKRNRFVDSLDVELTSFFGGVYISECVLQLAQAHMDCIVGAGTLWTAAAVYHLSQREIWQTGAGIIVCNYRRLAKLLRKPARSQVTSGFKVRVFFGSRWEPARLANGIGGLSSAYSPGFLKRASWCFRGEIKITYTNSTKGRLDIIENVKINVF